MPRIDATNTIACDTFVSSIVISIMVDMEVSGRVVFGTFAIGVTVVGSDYLVQFWPALLCVGTLFCVLCLAVLKIALVCLNLLCLSLWCLSLVWLTLFCLALSCIA